jgi:hypothetical protein
MDEFAGYGSRIPPMMEYGHGSSFAFVGPIVLMVLGAALVAGLVWALTRNGAHARTVLSAGATSIGSPLAPVVTPRIIEDDALRITRERLAKGEITVEEYTVIAEALRG